MIGGFLCRGLLLILEYAYPAYECYKTVEKNKPEIDQLRFWCQYWILIAMITVFERVGDAFVAWLPLYGEAKLAFIIYLWHPKSKGTKFIYDSFFKPYIAKHESEIDGTLLELRTRAGDMAYVYIQKVAGYGQSRFFEILQFVAAQSNLRPRPAQPQQPPPPPKHGHPLDEDEHSPSTLGHFHLHKSVSMPVGPESEANETVEPASARAEISMNKTTSHDKIVLKETIRVTRGR